MMLSRREFLERAGGGFGMLALSHLWAGERPHHPPRARSVIHLFMNGGASQCDTFDYKPELFRRHGEAFDPGERVESVTGTVGKILGSPMKWKQHGQCGRWVSSVFPHVATHVDDLAFLMAMQSKTNVHGPGVYLQCTGFTAPGFPSLGAWISYGLGSLNQNLPSFVVLPDSRGLPYNSTGNFGSGFLSQAHAGTVVRPGAANPIANLFAPAGVTPESARDGRALLEALNRSDAARHPGDAVLEARIASYELAARMQLSAPEALDLAGEGEATRRLYGMDAPVSADFGRNCLIARRLVERGVRFVQLWSGMAGASGNWDNHGNISTELPAIASRVDRPIAGLLADLKSRGLLDETLVVWTTEFGRMPFAQAGTGRDHNGGTFVSWIAGAGIRGGTAYGQSDALSWRAEADATTGYDLHATMLHLLGIDHTKLTVRHNGIDRRVTDVHGRVVREILA
jgi:hypothetical protein